MSEHTHTIPITSDSNAEGCFLKLIGKEEAKGRYLQSFSR